MKLRENNSGVIFFLGVIASIIILILYISLVIIMPDKKLGVLFNDIIMPVVGILSTITLFYAAKSSKIQSRDLYRAWLFLTLAMLSWAIADFTWMILEIILNQPVFPSISDVFYLIFYPLFFIGIFYLPSKPLNRNDYLNSILDIFILIFGAILVYWNFLITPIIVSGSDETLIAIILSVAYPVADLVLLFGLFLLIFQRIKSKNNETIILLLLSAFILIISDTIFSYQTLTGSYVSGSVSDLGYILSIILLGLAGLFQITKNKNYEDEFEKDINNHISNWTTYLPYIWMIILFLLIMWNYYNDISINFFILGPGVLLIIVLFSIRHGITFNENKNLYKELKQAYNKQELKVQQRTRDLQNSNKTLKEEIIEREKAEVKLKKYKENLEELIKLRTTNLEKANINLKKEIKTRKKIEEELKKTGHAYKAMFENTGTATMIVEENCTVSLINKEAEILLGYSKEEVEGKKKWMEFMVPDELEKMIYYHKMRRIQPNSVPKRYETHSIFKDGKIRNIILSVDIIKDTKKSVLSFLDITELRNAENLIKNSLNEKDVLLREIHHRVKNNMQIISSLLNIQSDYIEDKKARLIFKESQNRIRSMTLVHENLYQSNDLAQINLGEYIKNLTQELLISFKKDPINIKINVNFESIMLNMDTIIPCGLIITELVTNSLKYAFPDNQPGQINIDFKSIGTEEFMLCVGDNGIGIPEGMDFKENKTLGIMLVNSLVNQLDGTIKLDRSHGTLFKIKFRELKYKKRI
jgi:PAS domain S-box-containing protein